MNPQFEIRNKVCVITGGSGFLGSQFSSALTEAGALTINWDLSASPAVDITDPAAVKQALEHTAAAYGKIDVLIHAAALNAMPGTRENDQQFAPYETYDRELWEKELRLNLSAAHYVTQAIAPVMMRQKEGSIIFIASDLALIAPQNSIYDQDKFKDIAYVTSKSGMLGLMRAWAAYLGPYNVRANALVPGGMYRNQPDEFVRRNGVLNMLGRMARDGEYNGAILFLSSMASSYMTGASLVIDGGRTAW